MEKPYKKNSFNKTLLRCLDKKKKAKIAMEEVHEGICATHANNFERLY
jgi:hypothetical protein